MGERKRGWEGEMKDGKECKILKFLMSLTVL